MRLYKPKKTKKAIIIVVALILLVASSLAVLFALNQLNYSKKDGAQKAGSGINYAPPTKEERAVGDDKKDEIVKESTDQTESDTGKTKVQPVISSWGQAAVAAELEVNGFVPSVVENGGTCTITLRNGSETVSKSKSAMQDAQSTTCGRFIIPFSELRAGTWQVQISYTSATSVGSSDIVSVEVK